MFHMCKDAKGNDYGWAKVLDYIGVSWDPSTIGGNCKGQMSLEDFMQKGAEPTAVVTIYRVPFGKDEKIKM